MSCPTLDALGADDLVDAKGSTTITVCLPAHNEAPTIGAIIDAIRAELIVAVPLVDEIVVIDDASTDATASVAAAAGATVLAGGSILPAAGARRGKGEAMWKSLAVVDSDLIVWVDADIVDFDPRFVTRLVEPLISDGDLVFTKGHYARPVGPDAQGGGRVTELVARPALSLFHPKLTVFPQPLSGEIAARTSALRSVPFAPGYGVDVGLLIDVADRFGVDRIGRADLGVRVHRNRPLAELAPQAFEVLHAILTRADVDVADHAALLDATGAEIHTIVDDRPPIDAIPVEWQEA